jgi:hypothetical protein
MKTRIVIFIGAVLLIAGWMAIGEFIPQPWGPVYFVFLWVAGFLACHVVTKFKNK